MSNEVIEKSKKIISERVGTDTYCTLSLIDDAGYPSTSAISALLVDGIETICFGAGIGSNKEKRARGCSKACVNFSGETYNISLVGDVDISTDPELKKKTWCAGLEPHFTGCDDPNFCVLVFKTKRYNLFVDWQGAYGEI